MMIWMRFFLILIFLFSFSNVFAQEKIDSVYSVSSISNLPDEQLNYLLKKMYFHNYDLKQAVATIRRLRAEYAVSLSALYPNVGLQVSSGVVGERFSKYAEVDSDYKISVPVSYEIDIWKRLDSLSNAALLESQSVKLDKDALFITLAAELMQRYYSGLSLRKQLVLLNRQMALAVRLYKITKSKFDFGMISKDEVYNAQQLIRKIASMSFVVRAELSLVEHSLKYLVGEVASDGWLRGDFVIPQWLVNIPEDLSSDLLETRPDLRSIELKLEAENFRVLAAKHASFAAFKLVGNAQSSSNKLKSLASGNNNAWQTLFQVNIPVFDGQRNKQLYEVELARYQEREEAYRQLLLNAFVEVENALSLASRQLQVIVALETQDNIMKKNEKLLENRFKQGVDDIVNLINQQIDLVVSEMNLYSAKLKLISYRIQLMRSLGGSWWTIGEN